MKLVQSKTGFTLVELLLVMAIIGILAGVLLVGMGAGRRRAKVNSALQTAESVTAELAHCYLNDYDVNPPDTNDNICAGAGKWPELNAECNYESYNNEKLIINCNTDDKIECDVLKGSCKIVNN